MTETFEVGQKVCHTSHGVGVVTYGPYLSTFGDDAYLVRKEGGGVERTWFGRHLSAIPETPKFTVGDVVTLTTRPGSRATVEYGPFDDRDVYVVKLVDEPADPDEIRTFTAMAHVMTKVEEPAPIKVGDRVMVVKDDPEIRTGEYVGKIGLVTDVGNSIRRELKYRVSLPDGGLWWVAEVALVDGDVYTHDGVTYDLSAKYRDRDGDVWHFARFGDKVVGLIGSKPRNADDSDPFTLAVRYGPLTRVTD